VTPSLTTTWCRVDVDGRAVFGLVKGDEVRLVEGSPFDSHTATGRRLRLADARWLVPVEPRNFYAAGLNYRAHVEWGAARRGQPPKFPAQPDVGYRSPNALVPTGADIVIPTDAPGPVEYEGELVAVVGRRARNLAEDEALGCVLGYTLGNDVSERTWQASDRTLWRAKNTDTFKPMGPTIVTGLDPMAQRIRVRLDGRVVSDYETGKMIFGVRQYIARMTRYVTLHPGDVIWFGCDGATEPALRPGSVVSVENDTIGALVNRVVAEP
jgi:2-keto-4-pentenoate hydratase/2-oxohepta-3-ene-1,7-dioic acid hydratase in catechol pathway